MKTPYLTEDQLKSKIKNSKFADSILVEKASKWPIKIGSIYRNKNTRSEWSKYKVIVLKPNKLFELISKDKNYHVRYSYKLVDANTTEMEYFEWVDEGELNDPFTQNVLEKLKEKIEI